MNAACSECPSGSTHTEGLLCCLQDAEGQVSVVTDMQFVGDSLAAQVDAERLSATVSRHQHGDQQVGGFG